MKKFLFYLAQALIGILGVACVFVVALSSNVFVGDQEYSLETVFSIENIKQVSVELGIVALIVGAAYLLWKN